VKDQLLREMAAMEQSLLQAIPASPHDVSADSLTREFQRVMSEYFAALEEVMPWAAIEAIYKRYE